VIDWSRPDAGFDWAERFDDSVVEQLARSPGEILRVMEHPDYAAAVPTPDHFIPMLYIAALAEEAGEPAQALLRGYALGSISMTCYGVGCANARSEEASGAAALPADVPAEQTNT
jgi:4,5-DOPA dioxygenase extradiol